MNCLGICSIYYIAKAEDQHICDIHDNNDICIGTSAISYW